MAITIKKVAAADFVAIAAIYRFYVENTAATFETEAPTAAELSARWQQHVDMPFIVACLDEQLVGFAYVDAYHQRHAYRFTVEDSIYIDPQYTRRGIGHILLENLINGCSAKNIKEIVARIALWEGSEASIKLHKKFGFKECGCLTNVGFKFDKFIDTALLQKSL